MKCCRHDSPPKARRPSKRPERVPLKPKAAQALKQTARVAVQLYPRLRIADAAPVYRSAPRHIGYGAAQ